MGNVLNGKKTFATVLNVAGMAVAFTVFMAIMIQVRYDWKYDADYENSENIFRVSLAEEDFSTYTAFLCRPAVELFRDADPDIAGITCFQSTGNMRERIYDSEERQRFVSLRIANADSGILDVFPFRFVSGNAGDFRTDEDCMLSESAAKKIFGNEDPVGKTVYADGREYGFRVVAVFRDFPQNSSVQDIILNIGDSQLDDYSEWNMMCYMRAGDVSAAEKIRKSMLSKVMDRYVASNPDFSAEEMGENVDRIIGFTNIHDVYFDTNVSDSLPKGNRTTVVSLFAVAVLVIVIAIINFINFSMASVPFDIRKINTMKVLGSGRAAIAGGILLKTLVTVTAAFLLSLLFLYLLSFSDAASYFSCTLNPFRNIAAVCTGLAVCVAVSFLSGIYPALYSTSFQPAMVLKGSFSLSAGGRSLRNMMVGFQYVVSFVLAASALYIIVQTKYMKTYDMGFTSDQILMVSPVGADSDDFRHRLMQNPEIKAVTFAGSPIVAEGRMRWGRECGGERVNIDVLPVSHDFIDFFGLEMKEGRGFLPSDEFSASGTFIMNEAAMAKFPSMHTGVRMTGHNGSEPAEIVGVVKDFNFQPMHYPVKPLALYSFGSEPWFPLGIAYVRISSANVPETMEFIRDAVEEFSPDVIPERITVEFLDESIGNLYAKEEKLGRLVAAAAMLAFAIAMIGVLGLVYFETQFRKREISLKRVYGASVRDILMMINRRYMMLALVSFAVSLPLSFAVIGMTVDSYPYKAPVPVWIFAVSLAAMLAVTVMTVTLRSYAAANANPAAVLKDE